MCTGGTPPTATTSGFRRTRQLRSWRQTSQHEVSLHGCWRSAHHLTLHQSSRGSPCEGSSQWLHQFQAHVCCMLSSNVMPK